MSSEHAYKLNTAYDYDRQPSHLKVYKSAEKRNKKKRYIWTPKATTNVMVMIVAAMVFAVVIRATIISDINLENRKLNATLVQLRAETEQSQVELNRTTDLNTVEKMAKSELDMKAPDSNQVVSLVLDMDNRTVKPNNTSGSFVNGLKRILSGAMEYLY